MKVVSIAPGKFSIESDRQDLGIVYDCINNALDLMQDSEFHARIGATHGEALQILKVIGEALDRG